MYYAKRMSLVAAVWMVCGSSALAQVETTDTQVSQQEELLPDINTNSGEVTQPFLIPNTAEGGLNILYYNDRPEMHGGVAVSGMQLALDAMGLSYTFTNDDITFMELLLNPPSDCWHLVVSGHHNDVASAFDEALKDYVFSGGHAIIEDWRSGTPPQYLVDLGSGVAPPDNYPYAIAQGAFGDMLGEPDIPIFNSGWGRYSVSVDINGSATMNMTAGSPTAPALAGVTVSPGTGMAFISGLNDDAIGDTAFDAGIATEVYAAMINLIGFATDVDCEDPDPTHPWNRKVAGIDIVPGSEQGLFDIKIFWTVELGGVIPDGMNLGTLIATSVNGAAANMTEQYLQITPGSGECSLPCGDTCGTMSTSTGGLFGIYQDLTCSQDDCVCRPAEEFVVTIPDAPLIPGDRVDVILRPALGGTPDQYLPDDSDSKIFVLPEVRPGDGDGDDDLDIIDFGQFSLCFTGDVSGHLSPQCQVFDFDGDFDVDLLDFGDFQLDFTGLVPMCVDEGLNLNWPLYGADAWDWVINNYVDLDPSGGIQDYMGGSKSYDGHRGIDIDSRNFRQMDANELPARAAQAGRVSFVRDNQFDRNMSWVSGCTWNVVTIDHPNGYQTIYGHLKRNSVVVSVGQWVTAGQILGIVGSSGCSTAPHLHFEVRDCDNNPVDPFLQSMWLNPPTYNTPLGFMDIVLRDGDISNTNQMKDPGANVSLLAPGDRLGVGLHMGGGDNGDQFTVVLDRPGASDVTVLSRTLTGPQRHSYWWNNYTISNHPGTWRAEVRLNGNLVATRTFNVSTYSGQAYQITRHGIPSGSYQTEFNNLVAAGYHPVWIDGANNGGSTFFNVIFEKGSFGQWQARHGQTGAQYQATFSSLVSQGYHLFHVDSYLQNGNIRYASIFRKAPTTFWQARHGQTTAQFNDTFGTLTEQGYRIKNMSVVYVDGQTRITSLFNKDNVGSWYAYYGLTSAQYQAEFNTQVAAGRRLHYLNAYDVGGSPRFTAVWDSRTYGAWEARHNLTSAGWQAEFDDAIDSGKLTRLITGYRNGGSTNYAGLFTE
jgi:hypothetical protein